MTLDVSERTCHACGAVDPPGGLRLGTEGGGAEYEWFCRVSVDCARRYGAAIRATRERNRSTGVDKEGSTGVE